MEDSADTFKHEQPVHVYVTSARMGPCMKYGLSQACKTTRELNIPQASTATQQFEHIYDKTIIYQI